MARPMIIVPPSKLKYSGSEKDEFPEAIVEGMKEMGLFGLMIPEEYGGCSVGGEGEYLAMVIATEELSRGSLGVGGSLITRPEILTRAVVAGGTDAQKERYLRPLASGEKLCAFCLTEPHVGSDASSLRTTATKDGDGYVINGVKQFITSGKHGDVAIVIAVTDKGAGKKGMSAFLVPTSAPGYVVARLEDKLGQHSSDTAQINFDNCRIPAENLIGNEGEGYKIALSALEGGRIGIAAQSVGMARSALEVAIDYAKQRESFGTAIFNHQAVGFRLAECATQLEAARQLIWHAASLRDAGRPCLKEAAMAKLFASEVAEKVCSVAIQTLGGYGYVSDFPVERIYRDVRVCQIYEGTSDVQKIIIQRALA